jgi:hypothetical protein
MTICRLVVITCIKLKAITWNPACQKALDTLKYTLTHAPILAFPNYSQPFILTTDASHFATGAILSQIRDKKQVVIAYGGRKISVAEQIIQPLPETVWQ